MIPRIVYDDREEFPWLLIYGNDQVWAKFRTRKGAERELRRIDLLLEEYGVFG